MTLKGTHVLSLIRLLGLKGGRAMHCEVAVALLESVELPFDGSHALRKASGGLLTFFVSTGFRL